MRAELSVQDDKRNGRGRESGLLLDMRIGQLWRFRDGKMVRYESFPTWEQALEAAGPSKSPLARD